VSSSNQADYERGRAALHAALEADRLAAAWTVGGTLSLEAALQEALVLAALPEPRSDRRQVSARQPGALSEREREVARLVAQGLRNREIADALVITEKTAANHVQRVLDKLGLKSRSQVAAQAETLGLRD
jgi:DNA-binding NarL/FixJ family response regulator